MRYYAPVKLHCRECGARMQRWGHSRQGKPRFYCRTCKKTATPRRDDAERRQSLAELREWLSGKETLSRLAEKSHRSRETLSRRFRKLMDEAGKEPALPDRIPARILIVDGTYIHSRTLVALVAIDEHDNLYWKFAKYESFATWADFLSSFSGPDIVITDGQKGLLSAIRALWPKAGVQRCQFHLVSFAIHYLGRKPKEALGKELLELLYNLKYAKTFETRDAWLASYRDWEQKYDSFLAARDANGRYLRPRARSARYVVRRALPHLFTFLDHEGAPNTTNLVEGWVNGAVAEALRLHRGLREHEKRALATIILSQLKRKNHLDAGKPRDVMERLRKADRARRERVFIRRYFRKKARERLHPNEPRLF